MRRLLLLVLFGCLANCGRPPSEPYTHIYVLNATSGTLRIGDHNLDWWTSFGAYLVHGESLGLTMSRSGTPLGTLKVVSIVPAEDPSDYDAAVTIREDSAGVLTAAEQSPYIDATVLGVMR
jgi:hypothetical protein